MNSRFALRKLGTITLRGESYTKITGNTYPVKDDISELDGMFREKLNANTFVYVLPTINVGELFKRHNAKVAQADATDNQLLTIADLANGGFLTQGDIDEAYAAAASKGREGLSFSQASELITTGRMFQSNAKRNGESDVEEDEAIVEARETQRNQENLHA